MAMNPVNPANVPPPDENLAAPMGGGYGANAVVPEGVAHRGLIHWGSVWAGLLATLLTFLLLETLVIGLGLFTPSVSSAAGAWATAIIGLIAFFVGGWVAGITSRLRNPTNGIINGLTVWGLGTALILLLSLLGLSALFGTLGSIAGQFYGSGRILPVPPVTGGQVAATAQAAAWAAFFSLVLSGIVAAIGGWLATRTAPGWSAAPRTAPPIRRNAPA